MGKSIIIKIVVIAESNGDDGMASEQMKKKARIIGQLIAKDRGCLVINEPVGLSHEVALGARDFDGTVLESSSVIDACIYIGRLGRDLPNLDLANGYKVLGLLTELDDEANRHLAQKIKLAGSNGKIVVVESEEKMLIWRVLRYIEDPKRDLKRFLGK